MVPEFFRDFPCHFHAEEISSKISVLQFHKPAFPAYCGNFCRTRLPCSPAVMDSKGVLTYFEGRIAFSIQTIELPP